MRFRLIHELHLGSSLQACFAHGFHLLSVVCQYENALLQHSDQEYGKGMSIEDTPMSLEMPLNFPGICF